MRPGTGRSKRSGPRRRCSARTTPSSRSTSPPSSPPSTTATRRSRPGDTEGTYRRVEAGLAPLADAGVFPLALGGDHSITLPELRVLAGRRGRMALVHLDSHTDTWEEYCDQQYFHATTFKRAAEA